MWATASIATRRSGFDNGANTVERAGYGSLKYSRSAFMRSTSVVWRPAPVSSIRRHTGSNGNDCGNDDDLRSYG